VAFVIIQAFSAFVGKRWNCCGHSVSQSLVLATALPGFNASFDVLGNGGYHRTLCDGMSVFRFLRFGTLVGGLQKKTYKNINPFHVWPSNTTIYSLMNNFR